MSTGSAYAKSPYRCVHYDRMFLASTIVGHLPHCENYKQSDCDELKFDIEDDDEI
jgi:hypothetical protein